LAWLGLAWHGTAGLRGGQCAPRDDNNSPGQQPYKAPEEMRSPPLIQGTWSILTLPPVLTPMIHTLDAVMISYADTPQNICHPAGTFRWYKYALP